jgi:hypothetical protein
MLLIKKIVKPLFIFVVMTGLHIAVKAQDQDTGAPNPGDDPAPIDGGISLLVAAGAAYGVKKYRDGRKKEEVKE